MEIIDHKEGIMSTTSELKASILIQALPYIQKYYGKILWSFY